VQLLWLPPLPHVYALHASMAVPCQCCKCLRATVLLQL
jgi:hypothetical protein